MQRNHPHHPAPSAGDGPLLPRVPQQPGPSPDSTTAFVPPLDVAVKVARQTLADVERLGYTTDANTAVWHLHGTASVLRMLLDALDAGAARTAPDSLTAVAS